MTGEEENRVSNCGHGCYVIGGSWIGRNPDCPTHNKKEEDLDDLAWDIIFDLISLRLIPESISVEDPMLNIAHKFIFKRIKKYSN